jgi:hypothetical protein
VEEINMKSNREAKIETEPAAGPQPEEITLQWVREQKGNGKVERLCAAFDSLILDVESLEKTFLLESLLVYREGNQSMDRPAEKLACALMWMLGRHPLSPKDIRDAIEEYEQDWKDAIAAARYMQRNYPQVLSEEAA